MAQEALPQGVNDRTWGVLSALSDAARNRPQGPHMFLTLPEHTLGRVVKEALFAFDSPSISGRHCRIFRKEVDGQSTGAVFIKDSSSNGTYVNGQRLRKDSPELRLEDGDVISLAAPSDQDNGFAYVFRDTSSGLKRKAELELSKNEDGKRMKLAGAGAADGPVSLADVRRLERSNQELRQKLELECNKYDSLNADLRAVKSSTETMVKEAVDQCTMVFTRKVADIQAELSVKASALEESSAKCTQQESVIEDLNNRLKAAAQSRMEAEEAVMNFKTHREELEKQLQDERNQWNKERQEINAQHKAAVDRTRAEAEVESSRQAEAFSRQSKQLEDKVTALQESVADYRVQIESQRKQLEEEREIRLNFEKRGQELQIQLHAEQHASATLKQELEKSTQDLQISLSNLEACKHENKVANSKIANLQLEKEEIANQLKRESQRFEGARDRILLRETQLRAFQSTAEEIAALQQKQQVQLQAMMQTLKADDAEYANAATAVDGEGDEHSESRTVEEEMKDVNVAEGEGSDGTHVNGTQVMAFPGNATLDLNEVAEETSQLREEDDAARFETEGREAFAPTQLNVTQLDATQLLPSDMDHGRENRENGAMMETQIAPEPEAVHYPDPGNAPGTPLLERDETDNTPRTPLLERGGREQQTLSQERVPFRRSSLCTADLVTSEVLGSDGNNSQDEDEKPEERRVLASQVGNSDSLQVRGVQRDDIAGMTIDILGSQSSAMPVKQEPVTPIDEVAPNSQDGDAEETEGETQEEADDGENGSDTDDN